MLDELCHGGFKINLVSRRQTIFNQSLWDFMWNIRYSGVLQSRDINCFTGLFYWALTTAKESWYLVNWKTLLHFTNFCQTPSGICKRRSILIWNALRKSVRFFYYLNILTTLCPKIKHRGLSRGLTTIQLSGWHAKQTDTKKNTQSYNKEIYI